jgi:hypothetical protein
MTIFAGPRTCQQFIFLIGRLGVVTIDLEIAGRRWRIIKSPDPLPENKEAAVDPSQRVIWISPSLPLYRRDLVIASAVCLAWKSRRIRVLPSTEGLPDL